MAKLDRPTEYSAAVKEVVLADFLDWREFPTSRFGCLVICLVNDDMAKLDRPTEYSAAVKEVVLADFLR